MSPATKIDSTLTEAHEHDLTMHVFGIAAAMVGVCLTGISLLRLVITQTKVATVGDDLLALDAVLFMTCCTLSFWSFKTRDHDRRRVLRLTIDTVFMVALALMTVVCGLIAYAIA